MQGWFSNRVIQYCHLGRAYISFQIHLLLYISVHLLISSYFYNSDKNKGWWYISMQPPFYTFICNEAEHKSLRILRSGRHSWFSETFLESGDGKHSLRGRGFFALRFLLLPTDLPATLHPLLTASTSDLLYQLKARLCFV